MGERGARGARGRAWGRVKKDSTSSFEFMHSEEGTVHESFGVDDHFPEGGIQEDLS